MRNLLPKKLVALRKTFRYAQADVAEKLNVSVSEYMSWENGNAVCTIAQFKELADLYHVELEELFDNAKTLTLPDAELAYASVTIPFGNLVDGTETGEPTLEDSVEYMPFEGVDSSTSELEDIVEDEVDTEQTVELEKTREINTREFEPTLVNEIVDDPTEQPTKGSSDNNGPNKGLIAGIIAGIVAVIAIAVFVISRMGGSDDDVVEINRLSQTNRLALGDRFSLYIEDNGTLTTMGDTPDLSDFEDVVQVDAANGYALGLKKDGTVVCSGSTTACAVDEWTEIVYISAGIDHSAGIKQDGTVVTTNTALADEVAEWTGISEVAVGEDIIIALTTDGSVKVAGETSAKELLENLTDIKDIAVGISQAAVVKNDGMLTTYALSTGSTSTTSDWTNIESVAITNNYVVGLKSDNTVVISTDDEEMKNTAEGWTNVRYVAGYGQTLVAVSNNTIVGVGDNTYNVYTDAQPSAEATETADQLKTVSNVQFNVAVGTLTINWDAVEGATSYEIKMNSNPETSVKSAKNSTSVATSRLTDGQTYTVTIQALSGDDDVADSEIYTVQYTYESAVKQLSAPTNINVESTNKGWHITWTAVENATSYEIKLNDTITTVSSSNSTEIESSKLEDGKSYLISVVAKSTDTKYSNSEEGKTTYQYLTKTVTIKVTFRNQTNGNILSTITVAENVKVGTDYSYEITAPDGYVFNDGDKGSENTVIGGTAGSLDERTIDVIQKTEPTPTPTPTATPTATPEPTPEATEETEG